MESDNTGKNIDLFTLVYRIIAILRDSSEETEYLEQVKGVKDLMESDNTEKHIDLLTLVDILIQLLPEPLEESDFLGRLKAVKELMKAVTPEKSISLSTLVDKLIELLPELPEDHEYNECCMDVKEYIQSGSYTEPIGLSMFVDKLIEILPEKYQGSDYRERLEGTWQLPNSLLEYIPPAYQEGDFLNRFLKPFEKILLGREDCLDLDEDTGLVLLDPQSDFKCNSIEHRIKNLHQVFTPMSISKDRQVAPKGFLEWLSDWTGFVLREDLHEDDQRKFLANIIQLYKKRGTKKNLEELFKIFTGHEPRVEEYVSEGFQIEKTSTIGENTYIDGADPYIFSVRIAMERKDKGPEEIERFNKIESIARSLIELEKPAHTVCYFEIDYPTMCIGLISTVGVDTILGTYDESIIERETNK